MAGELDRLLVRIEADTAILRREVARADKAVGGFADTANRNLGRTEKRFDNFAAQIGRSLLRFAVLFGTAQLGFKAFDAIGAAGDINDLSRAAALSTDTFQVFAFAAEKAGVGLETLSKSSQKFSINMSALRSGTGAFDAFLKQHLPTLRTQLLATKTQEQAYNVLAEATKALKNEEDQTALAVKAFGKAGGEMVEILMNGAAGLAEAEARARELGLQLSKETVDGAEAATDGFRELTNFISTHFVNAAGGAFLWLQRMHKAGQEFQAQQRITASIKLPAGLAPATAFNDPSFMNFGGGIKASGASFPSPYETSLNKGAADNSGRDAMLALQIETLNAEKRTREAAYLGMDQELAKFKELLAEKKITSEQFETARQQLATQTKIKIGETITEENELYREQFREIESLLQGTLSQAFSDVLETGKFKAGEFFKTLTKGFAELTYQALILKPIMDSLFNAGGLGSGLFGGIFSPARAAGGPVVRGQPYMTGERGPELFVPNASGRMLNANQTAGMGSGVTNNYIDARGADISVAQRIERALSMSERSRRDPVSSVSKQQRRFPTRTS